MVCGMAVAQFPRRQRVIEQLGLARRDEEGGLAEIDAELRRVDNSIRALQLRRGDLLAAYRATLRQILRFAASWAIIPLATTALLSAMPNAIAALLSYPPG